MFFQLFGYRVKSIAAEAAPTRETISRYAPQKRHPSESWKRFSTDACLVIQRRCFLGEVTGFLLSQE